MFGNVADHMAKASLDMSWREADVWLQTELRDATERRKKSLGVRATSLMEREAYGEISFTSLMGR